MKRSLSDIGETEDNNAIKRKKITEGPLEDKQWYEIDDLLGKFIATQPDASLLSLAAHQRRMCSFLQHQKRHTSLIN